MVYLSVWWGATYTYWYSCEWRGYTFAYWQNFISCVNQSVIIKRTFSTCYNPSFELIYQNELSHIYLHDVVPHIHTDNSSFLLKINRLWRKWQCRPFETNTCTELSKWAIVYPSAWWESSFAHWNSSFSLEIIRIW